jgi:hypothetical protein
MAAGLAADIRARGQEVNVTYMEWVRFAQVPRAAYLAGIIDHILIFKDETALKCGKCLERS